MVGSRVAVVTGANQGIGYATVKELCKTFSGSVYLTSRNENLGRAAVEELGKLGLHPKYHQLDIDDESSVLRLRDYLKATYSGLDILVNNAAMLILAKNEDSRELFTENTRSVVQTNFFNTLRVCNILFPLLRPHARVVNLSSSMGHISQIEGQSEAATTLRAKFSSPDLSYDELLKLMNDFLDAVKRGDHSDYGWPQKNWVSYIASKIAVSAMTRIQQRDFNVDPREDIIVNHVHPGYVNTKMASFKGVLTIEQGAAAPSWLAMLPPNDATNPKGAYVWHDKTIVDWVNGLLPAQY
ncbi:carbonyl reductase [NADPH] 3-like [Daphnia carinata]|uniref:carbonyl reductase [NADPH] 3-like n=1 Tax=Daphnia carinata TaxID=120202 RepID=UPI00258053F2|nr:carbonyl reductase [NADPH] 3-like [Daphnia carinata]